MTSQSNPAALIEFATSAEALCSTTPTVVCDLSFARKELLLIIDGITEATKTEADSRIKLSIAMTEKRAREERARLATLVTTRVPDREYSSQ
jgi:hypothetical protein